MIHAYLGFRKKVINKIRSDMSMYLTLGIISLLVVFSVIVAIIGSQCFIRAFKNEYSTVTHHMADSAAAFINGDNIEQYLLDKEQQEYFDTKKKLDSLCKNMHVSLIYVIAVNQDDYNSFISVFNSVNNTVDNSNYVEWTRGIERNTTNKEYIEK